MGFGRNSFEKQLNALSDDEAEELDALKDHEQKTEEFESLTITSSHVLGTTAADNSGRKKRCLHPEY